MSFTDIKRREIKRYMLEKIDADDAAFIDKIADSFGISITSVKRYITAELQEKHIIADKKRDCGYCLVYTKKELTYSLSDMAENEDRVLFDDIFPSLSVNDNALKIWSYTLSEIMNNAIEHSNGKNIKVCIESCVLYHRITLIDDGIGTFQSILNSMKSRGYSHPVLDDAIVELYKGKYTSKPDYHSGEGIFFSMRLSDQFALISDGMIVRAGYPDDPTVIKSRLLAYAMKLSNKGTIVIMQLSNDTNKNAADIFQSYSDIDEGFIRTKIPVYEACLDHEPISRSQAKRIYSRLDSFKEVILDFEKVQFMTQGFADEMFRVFANKNPQTVLTPINMNAEVQKMYLYTIHNKVSQ